MREVHARYDAAQPPGECKPKVDAKNSPPLEQWQSQRLTRLCVHNLLCRIEARPLSVHIWGDSRWVSSLRNAALEESFS